MGIPFLYNTPMPLFGNSTPRPPRKSKVLEELLEKYPSLKLSIETPLTIGVPALAGDIKQGKVTLTFYELGDIKRPKKYVFHVEESGNYRNISHYEDPFEGFVENIPVCPPWLKDLSTQNGVRREGTVMRVVWQGKTYTAFIEQPFYPVDLHGGKKDTVFENFLKDQFANVVIWEES